MQVPERGNRIVMSARVSQLLHTVNKLKVFENRKVLETILEIYSENTCEFIVASSSMHPTLKTGDKITVEPVDPDKIMVGQVVVFKSESGKLIVHRVVKKEGFVLVTAGDSLRRFDHPVHIYDVVGIVKGLEIRKPFSKCFRTIRAVKRRILKQP
jgi:signal peptidase I